MDGITVGIIGLGEMGRLYASKISAAGWKVIACDKPENYGKCLVELSDTAIEVVENGHLVLRSSDYSIFSVEAESIEEVVRQYGSSTKKNAIIGGQTSCKNFEIRAFEKFLPKDVKIISCHSLHGPKVNPEGQPLAIINHRAEKKDTNLVISILQCLKSRFVFLSAEEHDKITADTQAVPHTAYLTMGSAWKANKQFPWEMQQHSGGIENVKINVTLRIYSNKWHVFAGLAIMNPDAQIQILEYSRSVMELFTLMIEGKIDQFKQRIKLAGEAVFMNRLSKRLLLNDKVFERFSLSCIPESERKANTQLSLLAMVDCWQRLNVNPYDNMICSTPVR